MRAMDRFSARRALLISLLLIACSPTTRAPDASVPATAAPWSVVFDDLPVPLLSVWQAPTGELFAVGGRDGRPLVLRHDATGWWTMDPGTTRTLWWVFGFSASQVYAVGERGVVTRFDGRSWKVQREDSSYSLWGLWGSSPSSLWAVGGARVPHGRAVVLRFDGTSWLEVDSGLAVDNLLKVWGTSASDVVVVGDRGTIASWNGRAFVPQTAQATGRVVTVAGSEALGRYAVGGSPAPFFLKFDGTAWVNAVEPAQLPDALNGVAVGDGLRVVVGGNGFIGEDDGRAMLRSPSVSSATLHAVSSGPNGFVAVGGFFEETDGRGVLLSRRPLDAGTLRAWPFPGQTLARDAGTMGTLDAGALCDRAPQQCVAPDECWLLIGPNHAICSRTCTTPSECGDFGPEPCCQLPGPQVTTPVCIPKGEAGCGLDGG